MVTTWVDDRDVLEISISAGNSAGINYVLVISISAGNSAGINYVLEISISAGNSAGLNWLSLIPVHTCVDEGGIPF